MLLAAALAVAQRGGPEIPDVLERPDIKLPSGKSQREEIAREDYKHNVTDSARLAALSAEVRDEFAGSDSRVVSVKMLRKLDDIDKLTHGIRGRLKRN